MGLTSMGGQRFGCVSSSRVKRLYTEKPNGRKIFYEAHSFGKFGTFLLGPIRWELIDFETWGATVWSVSLCQAKHHTQQVQYMKSVWLTDYTNQPNRRKEET